MKETRETYDGLGNILSIEEVEVSDIIKEPTQIEVRLAALEAKVGVTLEDRQVALKSILNNQIQGEIK